MWDAGVYRSGHRHLQLRVALLKMFLLLVGWVFPMQVSNRQKLYHWIDVLGKWSLLDTYVMALMQVAFNFNIFLASGGLRITVYTIPRFGFVCFLFATCASLLAGHWGSFLHRLAASPVPRIPSDGPGVGHEPSLPHRRHRRTTATTTAAVATTAVTTGVPSGDTPGRHYHCRQRQGLEASSASATEASTILSPTRIRSSRAPSTTRRQLMVAVVVVVVVVARKHSHQPAKQSPVSLLPSSPRMRNESAQRRRRRRSSTSSSSTTSRPGDGRGGDLLRGGDGARRSGRCAWGAGAAPCRRCSWRRSWRWS